MGLNQLWKMWAIAVLLLLNASPVSSTYWTVTSYYQYALSSTQYGTYTDDIYFYTYTTVETVKSGVTPTATPVSTSSYVYTYDDVTVIYVYLAPGAVAESDIVTTTEEFTIDNRYTVYVEPVV